MHNGSEKNFWDHIKDELHDQWSQLSDQELDEIRGKWKLLSEKLVEHYGWSSEEAHKKVHMFLKKHGLLGNGHEAKHVRDVYEESKAKFKKTWAHVQENPAEIITEANRYLRRYPLLTIGFVALAAITVVTFVSGRFNKD